MHMQQLVTTTVSIHIRTKKVGLYVQGLRLYATSRSYLWSIKSCSHLLSLFRSKNIHYFYVSGTVRETKLTNPRQFLSAL